ncbi:MAG TPA: DUF4124 domain-containing protein [Candidatus Desulfobacillus sp.]|mgnify:CR=1 FL=1|nr:DUF4124 domain-containing protein [Candidatus Desulfobacillus sp.]
MNILGKIVLSALLAMAVPVAAADVYKCVDEEGHVTYTNTKPSPKDKCNLLSREPRVSTVPGRAAGAPSPAAFPKVDGDTQRARDNDRRKILEEELATEMKSLEAAKKELAEQETNIQPQDRNVGGTINIPRLQERVKPYKDKVSLHERNVEALKKEIGNLR